MNIGIFGGSFNPPHKGHLIAAKAFCQSMKLDKIIVIPAGTPPHKNLAVCCSDADRLEMARLNFASLGEKLVVSDTEIRREGKSYTLHTLLEMKQLYPEDKLFLYCGSDMALSFHTWYHYEEILSLCRLCVMKRESEVPGFYEAVEKLKEKAPLPVYLLEAEPFAESSTDIRNALEKGLKAVGLVPEVESFIKRKGLYL